MIGSTTSNVLNDTTIDKYFIIVIDYDGTIIDKTYMYDKEIYTLPSPPSHSGLVFQEWSSSEVITNNQIIINNNNVIVGPVYTTVSGLNEFDVELNESTGLSVTLKLNDTKDWGDGTSDSDTTHTYSNYGKYTIKCAGSTITASSTSGLFGQRSITGSHNTYVKNVRLATVSNIKSYSFIQCDELECITISNTLIIIGSYSFRYCAKLKHITIPGSKLNITESASYCFSTCSSLISVVLPYQFDYIDNYLFYYCYNLRYIVIPNTFKSVGRYSFYNCYCLDSLILSDNVNEELSLGDHAFYNCYSLNSVRLPNGLTTIQDNVFYECENLKSLILPENVTSIGTNAFYRNYNLKSLIFPSGITNISNTAFALCYSILDYDFTRATIIPTLSAMNAFDFINQLCKITVPFNLYSDWRDSTNWVNFKKYIYSTGQATINFINPNNINIYVDDELLTNNTIIWGGTYIKYYCYDNSNNIVTSIQTETGIIENSTHNINIDLSNKKKITLNTGVSGLNATFTINDKIYSSSIDNGNYYIYILGNNVEIDYYINGGDNYLDASGTITTTNSDITENITMVAATSSSWTRPDLTANGTLGGDSFAVEASTQSSSSYAAWKAVDSDTSSSSYWGTSSVNRPTYTFYNPDVLKVFSITFYYTGANYRPDTAKIQGSNNNINFEDITSEYTATTSSPYTGTLTLTNNKYYKYYKINFECSSSMRIMNMVIQANVKTIVT